MMIPHYWVSLSTCRVGNRMPSAIEWRQSQGWLPGFGVAFPAIRGKRGMGVRHGARPKRFAALDEIERNPYKACREEGQPVPASFPKPGCQRSAGVIDGV